MKIGVISQARMTSTRLPGKVLMKAGGKTLLEWHLHRLRHTALEIVVATTENDTDNPIVELCKSQGFGWFRGSETDVLERYYLAALKFGFEHIVRVTSDCPLIDPWLLEKCIDCYTGVPNPRKYFSLSLSKTFPRGFDLEIFPLQLLEEAFISAKLPYEREHVTPYLYYKDGKGVELITLTNDQNTSDLRVTVDTDEDFKLIERLINEYDCGEKGYKAIEDILIANPFLASINKDIEQKKLEE
jgi:spore coat polysaccharide biosynthesis protein SpsF